MHRAGSIPALGTNRITIVYDIRPLHETVRLMRYLSMNMGKTSSKAEKTILYPGNWGSKVEAKGGVHAI